MSFAGLGTGEQTLAFGSMECTCVYLPASDSGAQLRPQMRRFPFKWLISPREADALALPLMQWKEFLFPVGLGLRGRVFRSWPQLATGILELLSPLLAPCAFTVHLTSLTWFYFCGAQFPHIAALNSLSVFSFVKSVHGREDGVFQSV